MCNSQAVHGEWPVSAPENCILAMNRQSPSRHRERSVAIHFFLVRRHGLPRRCAPRHEPPELDEPIHSSSRAACLPARKLHSIHEPALLQSSLRAASAAWQSTCTAVLHHGLPRRFAPRSDGSWWVHFAGGSWRGRRPWRSMPACCSARGLPRRCAPRNDDSESAGSWPVSSFRARKQAARNDELIAD